LVHLDELIAAIQSDISIANTKLDTPECQQYKNDPFFLNE
jgi:hypothetical protein